MRIFRRSPSPVAPARERPRDAVTSIVFIDEAALPAPEARARLRRVVAEAVVLQDQAEAVIAGIRDREPLARMAGLGGPVSRRFFALRDELPVPADGEMARQCETASVVLDYLGTLIVTALKLLAADWRSPAVVDQLERLDGLGAPAERLEALYRELAREPSLSA
jgi:hypothetical protein